MKTFFDFSQITIICGVVFVALTVVLFFVHLLFFGGIKEKYLDEKKDMWLPGILSSFYFYWIGGMCLVLVMESAHHEKFVAQGLFTFLSGGLLFAGVITAACSFIVSVIRFFPNTEPKLLNKFLEKTFGIFTKPERRKS